MENLRSIWSIKGWLEDRNGDDVPDDAKVRFVLGRGSASPIRRGLVELAGRLGLETTGLTLPLIRWDDEAELLEPCQVFIGTRHKGFCSAVIPDWHAWQDKRDALGEGQGLIAVVKLQNGENATIVTGKDQEGVYNACLYLASFADEESAGGGDDPEGEWIVDAPAAREADTSETYLMDTIGGKPAWGGSIGLESLFTEEGLFKRCEDDLSNVLRLCFRSAEWGDGESAAAADLTARIALEATGLHFPLTKESADGQGNEWLAIDLQESDSPACVRLERPGGKLRLVVEGTNMTDTVQWIVSQLFGSNDRPLERTWRQAAALLRNPTHPMRERLLHEIALERKLRESGGAKADIALAERFAHPIGLWRKMVDRTGAEAEIQIVPEEPAFIMQWDDAGEFARVTEQFAGVLPSVKAGGKLRVEAGVTLSPASRERLSEELRRLAAEQGITAEPCIRSAWKQGYSWIEQEVLPLVKANPVRSVEIRFRSFEAPDERNSLELKIRWLQELYPIDEVIGSELGIGAEQVAFVMDDRLSCTYRVIVRDREGEEIQAFEFEAKAGERLFLPGMEEEGRVYPPAGWLRITAGEEVLCDRALDTDPERFWDWYQGPVLRRLTEWVEGKGRIDAQLFGKLDCRIRMDTEERILGVREETFSVLEALHEDIYFNTLDYMSAFGKRTGRDWEAPGQILPWLESVCGAAPAASVEVYDLPQLSGRVRLNGQAVEPAPCPADLRIAGIFLAGDEVRFLLEGDRPDLAELEKWLGSLYLSERGESPSGKLPGAAEIPMDRVIDDRALQYFYANIPQSPGVSVQPLEASYQGREISVVEVTLPAESGIVSSRKLSLWKPTIFINARHHANEVSSTNAALKLIGDLAGDESSLLKRCSIVFSPMANPDGVAAHYAMFRTNPRWKLHAARYNAAGFEFARHRFRDDTPYGESRIYGKVWKRWAPDVIIDDHGVPSHEWVQPFSGYNSPPRFPVSYWLPNALIYTIVLTLDDTHYPLHAGIRESVLSMLAGSMKAIDGIRSGNEYWLERNRKWGNRWLPERFPLEIEDGLITYRLKGSPGPDSCNPGERYSSLVSLDLITEAADETADGAYLEECARAHYELDLAVVRWLAAFRQPVHRKRTAAGSGTVVSLSRPRPIQM
ncbi:M14 family metallopeptidase [Paenibacillus humicola]|uniref:M14 family metallopeptidase n=1 Tax=Paenibacillus humicola TaxID=3110540 RepID=UPI00237B045C|nr:M14 family metallopeptidase [Paenibacillus humicola]